jgi:hypothetical protein
MRVYSCVDVSRRWLTSSSWIWALGLFVLSPSLALAQQAEAPRILEHPKSQIVTNGETVHLEVRAAGSIPLRYQWHLNQDDLPGETDSVLVLPKIQFVQAGSYSVTVSNPFGEATSRPALVRVSSPPVILEPPENIRAISNQVVEFRVKAVGTPALRYQWFTNNEPMPNEILPTLKLTARESARYHVRVTNDLGFVLSQPVLLEVNIPPTITRQPVSETARLQGAVTFTVEADGTQPLSYQWRHNGQRLEGETNATLTVSNVQPADGGEYDVIVVNVAGAAHSDRVLLFLDVPFIFLSDRFDGSEPYSGPSFIRRGDNLRATNDPEERHCERDGGSSVWLRWFTKEPGIVRFETSGSSFDTVIAAYYIDASGQRVEVACDDDQGAFLGSRIHFVAMPDTIYYIAIDGLDGARGHIILDWEFTATPESLPIILRQPEDQTAFLGETVVFKVEVAGDPDLFIWYRNGVEIPGQNTSELRLQSVTREDIGYYAVEIFQGRRSVMSRRALLQVSLADMDTRLLRAFAFDKFADAVFRPPSRLPFGGGGGIQSVAATAFTPVLGYTGTQIFSTVGYGGEPGELSHCGIPGGASAWFAYIATNTGTLYLDTAGSSFNTVLAVYTGPGPTLDTLTALICDNDSGPGTTSRLNFPVTKDNIYYIAVDGLNGVTGTAQLNYRLLIPITLTQVVKTNETTCRFRITATPSYPFTIERCVGLSTWGWAPVLTTNRPNGVYNYVDTNATVQKRFYRVIQTP